MKDKSGVLTQMLNENINFYTNLTEKQLIEFQNAMLKEANKYLNDIK